jgi:hypothetical protein
MDTYLPGNLALTVAVFFHRLIQPSLQLPMVGQNHIREKSRECRTGRISLAPWNLGHVFMFLQLVAQLFDKVILSQKGLTSNLGPDRRHAEPPRYELSVFLLGLAPLAAKLAQHPGRAEAGMRLCSASCGQVAGPCVVLRLLYHPGADGIKHDVAAYFQKVAVLLDEDGFVPSLQQMARPSVAPVKELDVDTVQLAHANRQVAIWGFDHEMIVIAHEAVGVADPVVPLIHMLEGVQKIQLVLVVLEDELVLVATESDMVDCAGIFDPEGTGQEETLT